MTKNKINEARAYLQYALQYTPFVYGKILYHRNKAVKKAISNLKEFPIGQWMDIINIDETYLKDIYKQIYLTIGIELAERSYNNFSGKKSMLPEQEWERSMIEFVEQYTGQKIKLISVSLKKQLQEWLQVYIDEAMDERLTIEEATLQVQAKIQEKWASVRVWQCRRIATTEILQASSVAQYSGVEATNIPYKKTWYCSGINTRDAHSMIHGQSVEQGHFFYPNGEKMEYPRDIRFGASAGNIINCACSVIYEPK